MPNDDDSFPLVHRGIYQGEDKVYLVGNEGVYQVDLTKNKIVEYALKGYNYSGDLWDLLRQFKILI